MKISLICYFVDLIVKILRFTRSQNVPHFGMKCSKSLRFLGLGPRPRWGAYDAPPQTPYSREEFLAFENCSFALAI